MTTYTYNEVRWQCRECRAFVADASVESRDIWDPIDTYYGFSTETWCFCKRCGKRTDEPLCVPVRERTFGADRMSCNHPGSYIPEWMWREYDLDHDPELRGSLECRFTPLDELFREVLKDAALVIEVDRRPKS